jgi:hypothetical protein
METAACEDGLRDIVKGGLWYLYRSGTWLREWFESRGQGWMDEAKFKSWAETKEEEGEIVNGVRVVLEAWRLITS